MGSRARTVSQSIAGCEQHINGGGTMTRQDAEQKRMEAIAFALEGDPSEYDSDTQAITLHVSVVSAA